MNNSTFRDLLSQLAACLIRGVRANGSEYVKAADDAPEWADSEFFHECHPDDRMPDDWTYATISAFCDSLEGYSFDDADGAREHLSEISDGLVDVYSHSLCEWAADHGGNRAFIEEAQEEGLISDDATFDQRIQAGQYRAIEIIGAAVIDQLESVAENIDSE